jgi:hypothetical protein
MVTLHIEHPVSDLDTWRAAFDRFADLRAKSGVRAHTIWQPVDDPGYVLIDLDFDTTDQARSFETFLRTRVWAVPDNSPALAGTPITRILQVHDTWKS